MLICGQVLFQIYIFKALKLVRPDLIKYTENIPYLTEYSPQNNSKTKPEISRLVHNMRNEISTFHLKIILKEYNYNVRVDSIFPRF